MSPIRMDTVVGPGGKVELTVPLPAGMAVQVVVQDPGTADPEIEWDDYLQSRLDNLDRGGLDPRPWREVLDEARTRLRARHPAP
jgi:hypothetical protein